MKKVLFIFGLMVLIIIPNLNLSADNNNHGENKNLTPAKAYTGTLTINVTDAPPDCPAKDCAHLIIVIYTCENDCNTCHYLDHIYVTNTSQATYYYTYSTDYTYLKVRFADDPYFSACAYSYNTAWTNCTDITGGSGTLSTNLCP